MDAIILQLNTRELCLTIKVLSISKYVDKHFFIIIYSGSSMFGSRPSLRQPEVLQLANESRTYETMSREMSTVVSAVCITDEQLNVTVRIWSHPVKCEQITLICCPCDEAQTTARRKNSFNLGVRQRARTEQWIDETQGSIGQSIDCCRFSWKAGEEYLGVQRCAGRHWLYPAQAVSPPPTFSLSFYCSCLPQQ